MTKLIPLKKIRSTLPSWPYSAWATGELIRQGRLRCVRVGKRIFVTPELLESFIAEHTA